MKTVKILEEEAKKEGLVLAEEGCQKVIKVIKAVLARIPLESDETSLKAIAPIGLLVLSAVEPSLNNLIDFNKDGKIGE